MTIEQIKLYLVICPRSKEARGNLADVKPIRKSKEKTNECKV